jgi:hypothetical protein
LEDGAPTGTVAENSRVVVRDSLIVALGDSNGSGEGNPPWVFPQCDRSLASSQYQTAQRIEDVDPQSSVTLLFVSCSGARTGHLWADTETLWRNCTRRTFSSLSTPTSRTTKTAGSAPMNTVVPTSTRAPGSGWSKRDRLSTLRYRCFKAGLDADHGYPEDFFTHGYCSTTSYFVPIIGAADKHNLDGAFHPNAEGQEVTFNHTLEVVCNTLYGNRACGGVPTFR